MKKRIICLALLLCTALVLTACGQEQTVYPNQPRQDTGAQEQTAAQQSAQEQPAAQSQNINFNDGSYNPASEEDGDSEEVIAAANAPTAAPVMDSEYAGATPVRIDPVDKPTPTPLPTLTFSYTEYKAANLHLAFEGPAGWIVDDSAVDTYTMTYPNPSMDYEAKVVLRTVAVGKDYTQNELIKEVKAQADAVKSAGGFKSFEPSQTAVRYFIDEGGVYIAYKGNLNDTNETGVAGRIIVNTVNKTLYILHVSYPRGLADTFAEGVYNKIRHSMKLTD